MIIKLWCWIFGHKFSGKKYVGTVLTEMKEIDTFELVYFKACPLCSKKFIDNKPYQFYSGIEDKENYEHKKSD